MLIGSERCKRKTASHHTKKLPSLKSMLHNAKLKLFSSEKLSSIELPITLNVEYLFLDGTETKGFDGKVLNQYKVMSSLGHNLNC